MAGIVARLGRDGPGIASSAQTQPVTDSLRANTDLASRQDIFGAPTFLVDGELFRGDDRLEDAVDWARGVPPR